MRKRIYIAIFILLGVFASSSAVYAADSCPKDSVVGRSQDGSCVYREKYEYDDAGRTVLEEKWRMNEDSVLIGQSKTTTEYYPDGKVKETATWTWSENKKDWIGITKYEYVYNASGSIIEQNVFEWSSDLDDWSNKKKTEYVYNEKDKLVKTTIYAGNGKDWIPQTMKEQDYDGNRIILERYWSGYDEKTQTWIGDTWKVWEYKSITYPSSPSLYEEYAWAAGAWAGITKYDAEYDKFGRTIYRTNYDNYNSSLNQWEYSTQVKYKYDQWSNQCLNESYVWNKDYWRGLSKEEYEYNSNKKQIGKATYAWDDTNRQWIGVSKSKTLYDENENLILDEQYTWSGNDWAGTKKEEYIYDNNKLILSTIAYKWDVANKKWNYNTKVLADYNANKMQILDERYQWTSDVALPEGGYWQGKQKDSTVYDAKNVETASFSFQWDDENRRWLGNAKYRKEFDAANNLVLEEQYNWQKVDTMAAGGFWKGIKKEEYAYNAAKQQTLAIIYAWSDAIEDWIGNTKKISDFDSNKNQTLNEQYTWVKVDSMASGGYWQGTEKATYTFNKNKQQTSSWVYAWNDADTAWVYATRDTASYDAKKNQTLDERYTWDAEHTKWVGDLKKEYGYNASSQQIMFAYYTWDADNEKWIGTQKEEDEQDDEGRTIMKATYTWGTDNWQGKTKDTYTYFRNDTVAEHITYAWQTNKWVEKSKTEDSYSDDGQHTATATYTWNTSTNTWNGTKKTEWEYTSSGKIGQQTEYTWKSGWVNSTQRINTYTNDQLTAYVKYKWVNNSWQEVEKWEQIDANTERTYEWLGGAWSVTQEKKKEYDDQGRIQTETNQNWQGGVQTAGSKTEYTYTGSKLTQKSSYTYDSGISDWVETDRLTNAYDASNRQTLTMTQTFTNGVQTKGDKTTNTYNAEGKQTNTTTYKWENNDWQNVSKTDSEYSGNTTIVSNWQWDEPSQAWFGTTKEEKEYGTGKDVTITAYEWKDDGWVGTSKTGYTYYPNGKEKSVIDYRWTGSDWVADTKTEYEYSGSKNIVTATYSWENNDWVGQSKIGSYYDEGEDQTTATWDWKDGKWVGNTKMGETFDQFGNRTGQTTYTWNGTDFVYKQKTQTEYGISSKDKTTATYNWDAATNSWKGQSKSGVTYNGSKISSEITYKWVSGFTWENSKKTEYEYGTNANDKTTATYVWDATIPDWVGQSKSGVTYASNGKIASQFSYTWGGTDWIGVSKTEYEYGSGKNNSVAQYVWGDSTWVGKSKIAENYTEQGDSLSFYTYCWKNGDWADSLKTEYTYDSLGNIIYFIQAKMVNEVWSNLGTSTWWELEYDSKGFVTLDAHYTWNEKKNKWYGDERLLYIYDEYGNAIFYEKDIWSGTKWKGKSKSLREYNAAQKIILCEEWSWDNVMKDWYGTSKNEYGYFQDTIQNMTALYRWSSSMFDWEGMSKSEILYDEFGQLIAICDYTWSLDLWNWVGVSKIETKYDDKNRIVEQTTSRYDTAWYYNTKSQYGYDDKHGQVEKKEYTFYNDDLVLTYHTSQTYDADATGKLRTDLDASWTTTGEVTNYEYTSYYYACDPKFQITVEAKEGGSAKGGGEFILNGQATISATPEEGCYEFDQWDDGDKNATRRVLVTEDKTYTAIFTPIKRTIRASVKLDSGGAKGGTIAIKRKEY